MDNTIDILDCDSGDVDCLTDWALNSIVTQNVWSFDLGPMPTNFGGSPPLSDMMTVRDIFYHNLGLNWGCGEAEPGRPNDYFLDNPDFFDYLESKGY